MKKKCLNPGCQHILFEYERMDDKGSTGITTRPVPKLQHDSCDSFYICPACGAKNVIAISGEHKIKIVRYKF